MSSSLKVHLRELLAKWPHEKATVVLGPKAYAELESERPSGSVEAVKWPAKKPKKKKRGKRA